jgi:threonine dehydrogenase-like Zn-dependent dehydrogenase
VWILPKLRGRTDIVLSHDGAAGLRGRSVRKAKPSFIVSHELPLAEAPEAYKHFDARDNGWTKVVLKTNGTKRSTKRQTARVN